MGMAVQLPASISRTIQTKLVLPPDTNHMGTIFGGTVLSYIDEIAAITAMKHSKGAVVTASIDTVNFLSSAKVGDILNLEGVVISTGRTSMEVYVKVDCQNIESGIKTVTTTAILTMVAVNQEGKPSPVSGVVPETEEEMKLFQNAQRRKERRLKINEFSEEKWV
jgi:acyl-CoA hydrolase